MAEGVEYEIPNLDTKYFCHQCSKEVSPYASTELICPDCSSGFLEEVSGELLESAIPESYEFESYFGDDDNFIEDLFSHRRLLSLLPTFDDDDENLSPSSPRPERNAPESDSPEGQDYDDSFIDSILPVGADYIAEREAQLLRMRFFDDFSGDSEVDALASQLLDEVEISGPPPLSKDQIKALPVIILNETHIGSELQCTVCMNDYKLGEKTKKLTCEHLFHEKCITPWLERQASCPNCRQTVKVEGKNKRSLSCRRTLNLRDLRPRSSNSSNRRYSQASCPNCRQTVKIEGKNKRSLSCPRTLNLRPRSSNSSNRRFSEVSTLGDFFTASMNMNPFRFL